MLRLASVGWWLCAHHFVQILLDAGVAADIFVFASNCNLCVGLASVLTGPLAVSCVS